MINLLIVADGVGSYNPNISSYQYTCLAQGSIRDTYHRESIIARFNCVGDIPGVGEKHCFHKLLIHFWIYCSCLTEEEYEDETSACTQEALSELIAHLNENPDEYHKVVKRRKKEEAEGAGLVSYVKVCTQRNGY